MSSLPLQVKSATHRSYERRRYSLKSVNSVHVVRRRDLETRGDVGKVDLALGLGIRTGSLSCRGVGVLAPTLFTGCADVGRAGLLERLALECDGRDSATATRSDRAAKQRTTNLLGDEAKLHSTFGILGTLVDIESLSFKLNDIKLLQVLDVGVCNGLDSVLRHGVQTGREVVSILDLLLVDEVVVIDQRNGNERVLSRRRGKPVDLFRGLFEVAFEVELEFEGFDLAGRVGLLALDERVSPVHGGDLRELQRAPSLATTTTHLFVVPE